MAEFRPTYADLSAFQNGLGYRANAQNPLDVILNGIQQGVKLQQLPQTIQDNQLAQQLNQAIQAQKLADLQQGKVIEVGNTLVRQDPVTGEYKSVYTAPLTSSSAPEAQQFVGFDAQGNPLQFGTRGSGITTAPVRSGITLSGPLAPRTQAPETQQLAGFNADGTAVQFGNRGSGITQAPVQQGLNIAGPLQAKTQTAMRKGVLVQDQNGNVKYDVLTEGESLPEGNRIFTEPKAADESGLRKEFVSNPVVKDFTDIAPQYQRIQSAMDEAKTSKNFTAVDQTLVNTFNRILDPSSVVREAEYARTAADQSALDYLKGKLDPRTGRIFVGGAGLTPETREAMTRMAKRFFDSAQNNYTQTSAFYSNVARNRGFDPSLIVPPIGGFSFSESPAATNTQANDALQWLQQNPNDPKAAAVRRKLGL